MVNTMNPEKNDKKLTRWLLAATIVLLVLVLGLQLWQIFGGKTYGGDPSQAPDAAGAPAASQAAGPLNPPDSNVSPDQAALIEDIQALNPALTFDGLAALSNKELEQLRETNAPDLPVGMSFAAQAAEEYAGTLAVASVTSETDPELDEALPHYEVELHHPTLGNFEYKIDAYSGKVLEGTPNIMQSVQAAAQEVPGPASASAGNPAPAAGSQEPIPESSAGEEAAKTAAFSHAGVSAADAAGLRCKLDWDDGRQVYDIEFWVGSTEYDYEIDAATSAVLKAEQETNGPRTGTPAQQPGNFIGEEAAKSAALAHAGVSAADAGFVECELDEDDGLWVYEIKFRAGGLEYDYEIDAAGGTVVKAEQDR